MKQVGSLLLLFLVIEIAVTYYFYRVAFQRSKKEFLKNSKDLTAVFATPFSDHRTFTVEGAGHGMCYRKNTVGYQKAVADFIAMN